MSRRNQVAVAHMLIAFMIRAVAVPRQLPAIRFLPDAVAMTARAPPPFAVCGSLQTSGSGNDPLWQEVHLVENRQLNQLPFLSGNLHLRGMPPQPLGGGARAPAVNSLKTIREKPRRATRLVVMRFFRPKSIRDRRRITVAPSQNYGSSVAELRQPP